MRGVGSKAGDTRGTLRFSNILALTSLVKDLVPISSMKDILLHQKTPIRVLHRFVYSPRVLGRGGQVPSNLPLN